MTTYRRPRLDDASARLGSFAPNVLSGGWGTRVWPLSRKDFADQHTPALGGESPFRHTLRGLSPAEFARPIVVTRAGARFMARAVAAAARA